MSLNFGATAVGVRAREGVVLAADRRMTYGGLVLSRNARKLFLLNDKVGIAFSGLYGDISGLLRVLDAELKYYELYINKVPSLKMFAKRLSTIMYAYKVFPFFVEVLVGGLEHDGSPKIYVLDSLGSITDEDYAAVGSGATMALGVLEDSYSSGLSVEEAKALAIRAVRAAIERDAGSGDGIDVLVISRSGARQESISLRLVEERGVA